MYIVLTAMRVISVIPYIVCNDGDLRLVNGTTPMEGRVELCFNNSYGTICDDRWDVLDAIVTCRQLGFSSQGEYMHVCMYVCASLVF